MSIIFFDVDHTIIRHSTARYFIKTAVKKGILPRRVMLYLPYYYWKYRTGIFDESFFASTFYLIKGKKFEEIKACAETSVEKYIINDLYPAAVRIIKEEKQKGNSVVLATSSIDLFVKPLAEYLEVDYIATQFEFSEGISTGNFIGEPAFGQEKCKRAREYAEKRGFSLSECSFYSDSIHDLPLLKEIGKPYVVRPDRQLAKIMKKMGWELIHFEKG